MKKFLSIVLSMVMLLSLGALAEAQTADGIYEGTAEGMMGPITVSVTVEGGVITNIEVLEQNETSGIADPALAEIPAAIIAAGSTDVDAVAGATYTSEGIMNAVDNALMEESQIADGTYEGEAEGMMGLIKVAVTVEGGVITNIEVLEQNETAGIADPALAEIPAAIITAGSTDVDAVAGATYTSEGIMNAVDNALMVEDEIADGIYEGEAEGMMGPIKVAVTVEGGVITNIEVLEQNETAGISDPALLEIPASIVEAGTTEVDAVAGATYTSEGIMNAVENALFGNME